MKRSDSEMTRLTHNVIGAAIEVHRQLGPGFLESVCDEALCIELEERGIKFERQLPISVNYKGNTVGEQRLDLMVEDCLIVELKSVEALLPIHKAQIISYLKSTGLILGLLINFNVPVLTHGVQRIILSKESS